MEQTLNHFENAAFSATACDMEGTSSIRTLCLSSVREM